MTELLPVAADQRVAPELAALRDAVAAILEQGRGVNVVYAPTTIHHHATTELAPTQAPTVAVYPCAIGGGRGSGHPGIDVDLTGYGGGFALPVGVAPLPEVPESRSWAPLVLLISGWSGLGAVFATVLTGSVFAIGYAALALLVSAGAFCVVYRDNK